MTQESVKNPNDQGGRENLRKGGKKGKRNPTSKEGNHEEMVIREKRGVTV